MQVTKVEKNICFHFKPLICLMTLICFLKILKITLLFPFHQFLIQRPHIWSKAVIASLNWRMEALNQRGCISRCHLATLPVRCRDAWQSSSPPRVWRSFQDPVFWGARQRVCVVYHMRCHLCLVRSSKPLWEEEVSTRKEMGIPSGNETCLRSLSQLTS